MAMSTTSFVCAKDTVDIVTANNRVNNVFIIIFLFGLPIQQQVKGYVLKLL